MSSSLPYSVREYFIDDMRRAIAIVPHCFWTKNDIRIISMLIDKGYISWGPGNEMYWCTPPSVIVLD